MKIREVVSAYPENKRCAAVVKKRAEKSFHHSDSVFICNTLLENHQMR